MMMGPTTPSMEGVHEAWAAAEAEDAFWNKHYRQFLDRYPEQFVAVHEGTVVATAPSLHQLLHTLDERELDRRLVWVKFVTADPRRLMR